MIGDYKIVKKSAFELEQDKIFYKSFNDGESGKYYKLGQVNMIRFLYQSKTIDKETTEMLIEVFKKDNIEFSGLLDSILLD